MALGPRQGQGAPTVGAVAPAGRTGHARPRMAPSRACPTPPGRGAQQFRKKIGIFVFGAESRGAAGELSHAQG